MPGLEIKWRNGVAYAAGTVAGQRVRKSLGTRDPRQAEELRAQYEARLWKRHSYGEEAVRTFEEAALSYMNNGGEATFLPPLIRHFKGRVLGTIKPGEIQSASRRLYPDRKPATWNRQVISPARAVINHAAGLGWCAAIRVRQFTVQRVQKKAASSEWIDAFIARADADGLPHVSAALLFMARGSARVSEATGVLPEHVDLQNRVVWLEDTKTGKWQSVHLTGELVLRIANLPMTEGRPIFGYAGRYGLYARMKAVCRRAGLPWLSPHEAGRHSYATDSLARGASPRQVMEGGRWKSMRMVMEIYSHAENAGRDIADLFDEKPAKGKRRRA